MHSLTEIKYYGMAENMRHLTLKVVHSSGAGHPSLRTIDRILARQGLTHGHTGFYPGEEDVDFRS